MTGRRPAAVVLALVVVGAGALFLTALGDPSDRGSPVVGASAPSLQGRTLQGGRFRLRPEKNDLTIVNIWASWCGPCRDELPLLAGFDRRWSDSGVAVVTVNTRDGPMAARSMLHELGVAGDLVTVQDPEGHLAVGWGATGVPETFVVDDQGVVRARRLGAVDEAWLGEQVRRWAES